MKYKGYSQDTIPKIPNNCIELINLIERKLGIDVTTKTRKIEYIYARKIYYKILSLETDMTITAMAKTLIQNHATVLHALKNFTHDYNYNSTFKNDFDRIYKIYEGEQEEEFTVEMLEAKLLQQKQVILELKETMDKMKADFDSRMLIIKQELKKARSNNIRPRNQQTKIYQAVEGISKLTY